MANPKLERAGILLNMFAGILFGLEFFITEDHITWINNSLNTLVYHYGLYYILPFIASFFIISTIFTIVLFYLPDWLGRLGERLRSTIWGVQRAIGLLYVMMYYLIPILAVCILLLNISPKGVLGSIAVISFIIGNILQLLATYE